MSRGIASYLDANAAAPVHPRVLEALSSLTNPSLGNPSSIHAFGRRAKHIVSDSRDAICRSLSNGSSQPVDPEQLVFCSSGTEANQVVIRSLLEPALWLKQKVHWITTAVEHDSNLSLVNWVRERGGEVSLLPVNSAGALELDALASLWRPETALVSLIWVNNETGVINPIPEAIQRVRALGGRVHVDAAQAWGKLPISLSDLDPDYLTLSAHKIGGLAGTGAIVLRRGAPLDSLIRGKQEKTRRGGTENLIGIYAAGIAAAHLASDGELADLGRLRDRLEAEVMSAVEGVEVNGRDAPRVANTVNFTFKGLAGEGLVMALDLDGFAVSAGSACSSGVVEPSHVLMAMGRTRQESLSSIRVSIPRGTTWSEIEHFPSALAKTVTRMRRAQESSW